MLFVIYQKQSLRNDPLIPSIFFSVSDGRFDSSAFIFSRSLKKSHLSSHFLFHMTGN